MKILLQLLICSLIFYPVNALSQLTPTYDDIFIPMSDGDSLQADVYIPTSITTGEVILIQTPYNKDFFAYSLPMGVGTDLDGQPFIYVIVDWRGFYGSSMADVSSVDRGQDAYDVCDWIIAQPWHGDRIGTWGPSALAGIQYQLINKHHPNLTCSVPIVGTGHQAYESYFYGGVLEEARLYQLDALGYGLSPIVLANHYDSPIWTVSSANTWYADDIDVPTLQIGGWYDHNIDEMMDFYKASRNDADATVLDEQWLLVGPWVHGGTGAAYVGSSIQGELTYPEAEFKSDSMAWDFMNYYLLDAPNGWDLTGKITYYDMGGDGHWLTTNDDDIAIATTQELFLNTTNRLTSFFGLDSSAVIIDPSAPFPTLGGATLSDDLDQGPYDQAGLLALASGFTWFQTGILEADVAMTGRAYADLFISATVPDCDVAIRLIDVYPDGRMMLITDGIQRMRFRNGDYTSSGEEFMTGGEVYQVQVNLPFTNYTWQTGHRIAVIVSGTSDSRFNLNEHSGGPMYTGDTPTSATFWIQHSTTYPSKIVLPSTANFLENEVVSDDDFFIFPNPVREYLYFSGRIPKSYSIFNLEGKVVLQGTSPKNGIHIANLTKGHYILVAQFENEIEISKKVVIF